jgi:hypothetical protein
MSIRQEWIKHVEGHLLHKVDPFPGDPKVRTVLVSCEINDLLFGPWDDGPMGERCGRLLAVFQGIVRDELLKVCLTPFKARQARLGRLCPIEAEVRRRGNEGCENESESGACFSRLTIQSAEIA